MTMPDEPCADGDHFYLSTACFHLKHDQCRRVCKFCPSVCRCNCHVNQEWDQEIADRANRAQNILAGADPLPSPDGGPQ